MSAAWPSGLPRPGDGWRHSRTRVVVGARNPIHGHGLRHVFCICPSRPKVASSAHSRLWFRRRLPIRPVTSVGVFYYPDVVLTDASPPIRHVEADIRETGRACATLSAAKKTGECPQTVALLLVTSSRYRFAPPREPTKPLMASAFGGRDSPNSRRDKDFRGLPPGGRRFVARVQGILVSSEAFLWVSHLTEQLRTCYYRLRSSRSRHRRACMCGGGGNREVCIDDLQTEGRVGSRFKPWRANGLYSASSWVAPSVFGGGSVECSRLLFGPRLQN